MSEDVVPYGGQKPDEAARTDEFRALMEQLGFSQRQTAEALEVDPRTLRYWAASNPAPPLMAIYALRYLSKADLIEAAPNLLFALEELTPQMPPEDAFCHKGIVPQSKCGNCQRIARARNAIKMAGGSHPNVTITGNVRWENPNAPKVVTAKAQSFAGEGVRENRFMVDPDGTVWAFDNASGNYTARHALSVEDQARIRKLAAEVGS